MTRVIDKVAWICIDDRRLLGVRSSGKDSYYLPGGKRETDETDQSCLAREIKEELGIELVPESIAFMGEFTAQAHAQEAGVTVKMACYTAGYVGTLVASSEIAELRWLRYEDRGQTSPAAQLIFDWLKQRDLID